MPLYDYECVNCRNVTEVRHGFNDTYEQPCPACGGRQKRVINPAPVIFKGSGFYVTDSRKKQSSDSTPPAAPKTEAAPAKPAAPSGESAA